MKRVFAVLALAISAPLLVGCAVRQPVTPVAQLAPTQTPTLVSVTVHLCAPNDERPECDAKRRQWDRKRDERDLITLLLEDFKDTSSIDRARRDHIAVIAARIVKNKYD